MLVSGVGISGASKRQCKKGKAISLPQEKLMIRIGFGVKLTVAIGGACEDTIAPSSQILQTRLFCWKPKGFSD